MSRAPIQRLGLVGAIASGKSLASRWFAVRGWTVLDADRIAHDLYRPGTALGDRIVADFGTAVRAGDGSIDRKALGAIVFADPARLRQLEGLVHPALREELSRRIEQARIEDVRVVLEMALLARWPEMAARLDRILGISAGFEIRLERLMARNDLDRGRAKERLEAQEPPEVLLACADEVLVNEGAGVDLERRLEERFG